MFFRGLDNTMLKYITTGESHGKCLIAVVEGLPAGLKIDTESINRELGTIEDFRRFVKKPNGSSDPAVTQ